MVLMSFASACCHPLSVKRLMWAAMSDVTAMPFKGHPLACSGVISSTHTEGLQEGQYRTPISGQNDPTGEEQDSSTYLKIADHLLAKGIIGLYLHRHGQPLLRPAAVTGLLWNLQCHDRDLHCMPYDFKGSSTSVLHIGAC